MLDNGHDFDSIALIQTKICSLLIGPLTVKTLLTEEYAIAVVYAKGVSNRSISYIETNIILKVMNEHTKRSPLTLKGK